MEDWWSGRGREQPHPVEIASGVFQLETGRGLTETNVYFVRAASGWVLVDVGAPHRAINYIKSIVFVSILFRKEVR